MRDSRGGPTGTWRAATLRAAGFWVLVAGLAAPAAATPPEWHVRASLPAEDATPPLPPPTTFPVQLVLDDDSAEGAVGIGLANAFQFLWFNRFSPAARPVALEEIWVLFPEEPNVAPGDAIDLAVFLDPDGDPTNGATLLGTWNETVQVADGETFSIYPIPGGLTLLDDGDVLIGVVPRWIVSGQDPATAPAAIDTTASQGRSWIAVWSGDPPDPPLLPGDLLTEPVDGFAPGNWMIRAFGGAPPVVEVPALGGAGLALLALLLAALGGVAIHRKGAGR